MTFSVQRGQAKAERRRFPRKPLIIWVHYQLLHEDIPVLKQTGLTDDLGAGGLAFRCDGPLGIGKKIKLVLYLPPTQAASTDTLAYPEEECEPATLMGKIAWQRELEAGEGFRTGVEFLDVSLPDGPRLKRFFEQFCLDVQDNPLLS